MPKFRLKAGSFSKGSVTYNHKNPELNVVECDENLAAMHPEKFERIEESREEGPYTYNPQANRTSAPAEPKATAAMPALTPTTAKRTDAKGKTLDEQYGNLESLTVVELKEVAEAEEIDVKGVAKKEDMVKALRAHK